MEVSMKNFNIIKIGFVLKLLSMSLLFVNNIFSMDNSCDKGSQLSYILNNTIICVDDGICENKFNGHGGFLPFFVWQNLKQESLPMLVSGVILDNMVSMAKACDAYYEKNKSKDGFDLEKDLKSSFFDGRSDDNKFYENISGYFYGKELKILFDKCIVYKHKTADLFKIIPISYKKKISDQLEKLSEEKKLNFEVDSKDFLIDKILIGDIEQWKKIESQKDFECVLKNICATRLKLYENYLRVGLGCTFKIHSICPSIDLQAIKSAFSKKDSFNGSLKVYNNICFNGHSSYSSKEYRDKDIKLSEENKCCTDSFALFARMTFDRTKKWLEFINNDIDTMSCIFITCFAGGYHSWKLKRIADKVYQESSNKSDNGSRPVIMVGSLNDSIVRNGFVSDLYFDSYSSSYIDYDFNKYFEKVGKLLAKFVLKNKKIDYSAWLCKKINLLEDALDSLVNKKSMFCDVNGSSGIPVLCAPCKGENTKVVWSDSTYSFIGDSSDTKIMGNPNIFVIDNDNKDQDNKLFRKKIIVFEASKVNGVLDVDFKTKKWSFEVYFNSPVFVPRLVGKQLIEINVVNINGTLQEFVRGSIYQLDNPYAILFKIKKLNCENDIGMSLSDEKIITLEDIAIFKHHKIGKIDRGINEMIGAVTFRYKEQYYIGIWNNKFGAKKIDNLKKITKEQAKKMVCESEKKV